MQPPHEGSPIAQSALMAMAADLKLQPIIVAQALEYAFDNMSTFPSANQALCFGIVRQGHYVDMQLLHLALHKLRRNFGGALVDPDMQHVSMEPWSTQPTTHGYRRLSHAMTNNTQPRVGTPVASDFNNDGRCQTASTLSSCPRVGLWPMPRPRHPGLPTKVLSSAGTGSVYQRHPAETYGDVRL
ncbi:hypothetical protein OPT61_g7893 [Boeremia exigua]|uniref:Uncharacterized protein n=1 Tax=Boeremia exigua TaxID=749465 RepID=A0ACC2I118_9PLEO|nr:hypothetical protein OPT61_g7893 [Boeremia exigua]